MLVTHSGLIQVTDIFQPGLILYGIFSNQTFNYFCLTNTEKIYVEK